MHTDVSLYRSRDGCLPSSAISKSLVGRSSLRYSPSIDAPLLLVFTALRVFAVWNNSRFRWLLLVVVLALNSVPLATNTVSHKIVVSGSTADSKCSSHSATMLTATCRLHSLHVLRPFKFQTQRISCEFVIVCTDRGSNYLLLAVCIIFSLAQ